jgi:hypothetical protein
MGEQETRGMTIVEGLKRLRVLEKRMDATVKTILTRAQRE